MHDTPLIPVATGLPGPRPSLKAPHSPMFSSRQGKHGREDMEDGNGNISDGGCDKDAVDNEEVGITLDVLQLDDESEEERPLSPRHRFLRALISDAKVPPLPIIIRHHKTNEELNLAHRALGDDYIIYLSSVVNDLPSLTKLNLRDNRLTDRGMGVFIHALAGQQRIVDVDISENKIDSASADALTHYLKDPKCKLAKLCMSNADLDDDEIAIFMNALEKNKSIVEMDVSHNLLGGRGEKNAKNLNVNAQNLTGGASVAAALKHNNTLLSLNLSWNKLGLASSNHLGYALTTNNSLTSINLAYNTIRDEGAEVIGSSLALNKSLRILNLSSNGIGPQGTLVLSSGLRLCEGLERLDISGNPIGRQGVQSLLQTLNYHSVHRTFNLSDCVFDDSGPKIAVDLEFPTGKYSLDLAKPSNRCLVMELCLLASIKRGIKFKSIDFKAPGKNSKKSAVKLMRPENPCHNMGVPYSPHRGNCHRTSHPYTSMEASEWMKIVDNLSLVEESTGKIWDVPTEGILLIDCIFSPQLPTPIECLNSTGLNRLIELIQDHPKQYSQILAQCHGVTMETYQLDEMLCTFADVGQNKKRTDMILNLLGCCCDTSNVSGLLQKHMPKLDATKDLQLQLRSLYYLCTNSFTGHYCLDLENSLDRRTAIKLMAISTHENAYIKQAMPWGSSHAFTSQQGSKHNFRNETYRNMSIEGGIDASFFQAGLKDKIHGVLEFDFVSISRPDDDCFAEGNCNLESALDARGLLYPLTAHSSIVLRTRRKAMHSGVTGYQSPSLSPGSPRVTIVSSDSISSELLDAQSLVATGIEPPDALEEVLGSHIQSKAARIITDVPLPCPVVDFHNYAAKSSHKCLEGMKMEDLTLLNTQLNCDNAMFFDGKQMEKYVLNIAIRIQSADSSMFLEPTALLTRLAENGKFGFSGQGKNEESKISLHDILTVDAYMDTVKFDIGLMTNPNAKNMKPSHKKYILHDDVIVVGSEIFVEVKCPLWTTDGIVNRTKEVVASFFNMLGITETHVRLTNHKIVDSKSSYFPSNAANLSNCTNRVVVHQIDVSVDGLPDNEDTLIKTSSKAKVAYNNIVWKWRVRNFRDRGNAKVDLNLSAHEYWGLKTVHLRTLTGGLWLTCSQAAFIASRFPQFGNEGHPLRESVIVFLFSRVVDLENFRIVVATLPVNNYCGVYRRLGWLNAINPHEVDYLFNLDLSKGDERLMTATLAKFAAVEPGDNMLEPRHRRTYEDIFIFGWDVPASWCVDPDKAKFNDGVPRKGQVIAEYCSCPLKGCKKILWVREEFSSRYFLLSVPSIPWDEDFFLHATEDKKWEV
jgi:Ran GTPase-activating protein (RanGAP) involved in mRNA processing and transport